MEYRQYTDFDDWPEKDKKRFRDIYRKLTLWSTRTFTPIFTHDELEPIMASINFFPLLPGRASTNSLMKELGVLTGTESAVRENDNVNVKEQGENLQEGIAVLTESAVREHDNMDVEQGENLQEDKTGSDTRSVQWREYAHSSINLIRGSGLNPEMKPLPRLPYPRVDGLHLMSYLAFFAALECYINRSVVMDLFHIRPTPMDLRDILDKTVYKQINNFHVKPEEEAVGAVIYFYRENTFDETLVETYGQLKASVGNISCNETSKMYLRKHGTTKIKEDENDDCSGFHCLIDQVNALYRDGDHGELSKDESLVSASDDLKRDDRENNEASNPVGCGKENDRGATVAQSKRIVVKIKRR